LGSPYFATNGLEKLAVFFRDQSQSHDWADNAFQDCGIAAVDHALF